MQRRLVLTAALAAMLLVGVAQLNPAAAGPDPVYIDVSWECEHASTIGDEVTMKETLP